MKLILGDPAFVSERETPSFKFIRAARIPQRQCSSRVSDSRDAYRGEEQHGPLALGPVGLGHIPDIVRTRIKKRSLAVHLQGGDKGVTLRTVAWSTWSSAQVGREVSVAARSSRGWPTRRAGGQCRAQLNYRHDLARNRRFNCRWTDDFLVKVSPFEEILCRGWFRHPSRYRQTPRLSTVRTRTSRGPS